MTTRARKLHADILAFNRPLFVEIETRLQRGEDVPECLAKTLVLTREAEGLDELDILIMCGTLIIGGVETVRVFNDGGGGGVLRLTDWCGVRCMDVRWYLLDCVAPTVVRGARRGSAGRAGAGACGA